MISKSFFIDDIDVFDSLHLINLINLMVSSRVKFANILANFASRMSRSDQLLTCEFWDIHLKKNGNINRIEIFCCVPILKIGIYLTVLYWDEWRPA